MFRNLYSAQSIFPRQDIQNLKVFTTSRLTLQEIKGSPLRQKGNDTGLESRSVHKNQEIVTTWINIQEVLLLTLFKSNSLKSVRGETEVYSLEVSEITHEMV